MTGTECCRAAMTIMGAGADSSEYYAQFALGALNQLIANSLREINAERVQQGESAFFRAAAHGGARGRAPGARMARTRVPALRSRGAAVRG